MGRIPKSNRKIKLCIYNLFNYRSIFILSVLSKMFEKIILEQLFIIRRSKAINNKTVVFGIFFFLNLSFSN